MDDILGQILDRRTNRDEVNVGAQLEAGGSPFDFAQDKQLSP
jgi:hypothetical protein